MRSLCPMCQSPQVHDMNNCTECGTLLPKRPVQEGQHHHTPSNIDTVQPKLSVISETYDRWAGKRVRIKSKKLNGIVRGADSCPLSVNSDGVYLWVQLDKPNHLGEPVVSAAISDVEELKS